MNMEEEGNAYTCLDTHTQELQVRENKGNSRFVQRGCIAT